jgi:hypothetical protein
MWPGSPDVAAPGLHFNCGWHIPENNQTSMEGGKIEAKEQTEIGDGE